MANERAAAIRLWREELTAHARIFPRFIGALRTAKSGEEVALIMNGTPEEVDDVQAFFEVLAELIADNPHVVAVGEQRGFLPSIHLLSDPSIDPRTDALRVRVRVRPVCAGHE